MGIQGRKIPLEEAGLIATRLIRDLYNEYGGVIEQMHVAGSVRRECPVVNDIDIVIVTGIGWMPAEFTEIDCFKGWKFTCSGHKKATVISPDGVQVDFNACTGKEVGSFLLHCTGSMHHNIVMRKKAHKINASLSQYGLKLSDGKIIGNTEEAIFELLGMPFVDPKDR